MPSSKRDKLKRLLKSKRSSITVQDSSLDHENQGSSKIQESSSSSTAQLRVPEDPIQDPCSRLSDHDYSSQIRQHHPKDGRLPTQATEALESLWERAYKSLEAREPDLVTNFERLLASENEISIDELNPKIIGDFAVSKLEDREARQIVFHVKNRPIKIREQCEKVCRFILWSKDVVSSVVSAQPYLALAWSGVSILLPVASAPI